MPNIRLIFILLSLIHISSLYGDNIPEAVHTAGSEIVQIEFANGTLATGFFIDNQTLVTNFHAVTEEDKLLSVDEMQIIRVGQNSPDTSIKIIRIKALSALYDLALLEVEGYQGFSLDFGDLYLTGIEEMYMVGYPKGEWRITQANHVQIKEKGYQFTSNFFDMSGANGSPLLNTEGGVIGVMSASFGNYVSAVQGIYLQELQERALRISEKIDSLEGLFREEMENINLLAYSGHTEAQYQLGWFYENGKGVERDYNQAMHWYKKAAERGHVGAMFALGQCYEEICIEEVDRFEAYQWYFKAAEQGHVGAKYKLGFLYSKNGQAWTEYVQEFKWYYQAAEKGYVEAQFFLGKLYLAQEEKEDVERNLKKAVRWLSRAALRGHPAAQHELGLMYEQIREAALAGDAEAQFIFGYLNEIEIGERAAEEAKQWYELSAKQGDRDAQYALGKWYEREAIKQYRFAAEQGHVEAQFNLGVVHEELADRGISAVRNNAEAVRWHSLASKQNHMTAQFKLSYLYYSGGRGVRQNYEKEVSLLHPAAGQGHFMAQYNLGVAYERGRGVGKDHRKAMYWYEKAAEQGFKWAQYNLGFLYYNQGNPATVHHARQAIKWFKKAATQGYASGQHILGLIYKQGTITKRDYRESNKWYRQAAARGHPIAQRFFPGVAESVDSFGLTMEEDFTVFQNYLKSLSEKQEQMKPGHEEIMRRRYQLAIEQRDIEGQYMLARLYMESALPWYEKAALQGHVEAQYRLGLIYEETRNAGLDAVKNEIKSNGWYELAARQGHASAQYQLGLLYVSGHSKGIEKDDNRALRLLYSAAEQGHVLAQFRVGVIYQGKWSSRHNTREAVRWFRMAAEQGYVYPRYRSTFVEYDLYQYLLPTQIYTMIYQSSFQSIVRNLTNLSVDKVYSVLRIGLNSPEAAVRDRFRKAAWDLKNNWPTINGSTLLSLLSK